VLCVCVVYVCVVNCVYGCVVCLCVCVVFVCCVGEGLRVCCVCVLVVYCVSPSICVLCPGLFQVLRGLANLLANAELRVNPPDICICICIYIYVCVSISISISG